MSTPNHKIISYAVPSGSTTPLADLPDHLRPHDAKRITVGAHTAKVWHERHPVTGRLVSITALLPVAATTPNWIDLI